MKRYLKKSLERSVGAGSEKIGGAERSDADIQLKSRSTDFEAFLS